MKEGGAVAVATPSSSCRLLYKAVPGNPPLTHQPVRQVMLMSQVCVYSCVFIAALWGSPKKKTIKKSQQVQVIAG